MEDQFDEFLLQIRNFIEYLEAASVKDSAKLRLKKTLDWWEKKESELINIRTAETPVGLLFNPAMAEVLTWDRSPIARRYQADHAWVKSQTVNDSPKTDLASDSILQEPAASVIDEAAQKREKLAQRAAEILANRAGNPLITYDEAGQIAGKAGNTIRGWCSEGKIECRIGKVVTESLLRHLGIPLKN